MTGRHPEAIWCSARGELRVDAPVVMGILNLTPDSFSDGGELRDPEAAVGRGARMVEEGAHILDVGGESTRPGARPVDVDEERRRVVPAVEALVGALEVPVSIDTRKADVARAALQVGAAIVNDVSALSFDPAMAEVVAEAGAGVVLMHMRGVPSNMQMRTRYRDVAGEVTDELEGAVENALRAGISRSAIAVDPGIGFAKTAEQSWELLARLERLRTLGLPILVGPSRKSFLEVATGAPVQNRAVASAVACAMAYRAGARIFRVHDVAATIQALSVAVALERAGAGSDEPMEVR